MADRINRAFGEAVSRFLDERNLSHRQTRIRTGIDIDTVGRMRAGDVPRIDKVIDFARGFDEPINKWLELAGYPPIKDDRPPLERIREAAQELTYEPEMDDITLGGWDGAQDIPPEDLELMQRYYRALLAEKRRQQGRE
jgi:hypothetical protein